MNTFSVNSLMLLLTATIKCEMSVTIVIPIVVTFVQNKLWFLSLVNNLFQTSSMVWPHNKIWGPMVRCIPFCDPNYSHIYLNKTSTSSLTLLRKHYMFSFKDHLSILAKKRLPSNIFPNAKFNLWTCGNQMDILMLLFTLIYCF